MQETREGIGAERRSGSAARLQTATARARRDCRHEQNGQNGSRPCRSIRRTSRKRKRPPKTTREMTLEIAAKEYIWLWDRRHGSSIDVIAAREGVSIGRVRFGLARARAQEKGTVTTRAVRPPRLVPLFPIGAYTPQSLCAHRRPIEPGSSLCCMICHRSGMDRHPALRRDPRNEPTPEPKPRVVPVDVMSPRETRKERRQRLFGVRS